MNKFVVSLLLLISCLSALALMSSANALIRRAHAQNRTFDILTNVRLWILISDIDPTQKSAQLQISAFLDDFPLNVSGGVGVYVTGGGSLVPILCSQTGQTRSGWSYQGESAQMTWLLDGFGENFPFDSYTLNFYVYSVTYVGGNYTLASTGIQAYFVGAKSYSLDDLWYTKNNRIPISSNSQSEVDFSITRSTGATVIYFLEFLAPIIACFYLLGATLMLDPKSQLSERLGVYVSLFVFAPLFLIAIRDFLPYRSTLSFPELLLVNLVISNAIFAIFNIVGRIRASQGGPQIIRLYRRERPVSFWDGMGAVISLFFLLTTYILTLIWKVNIPTSFTLTYLVIPSYPCSIAFLTTRRQFMENWQLILLIIIAALLLVILWLMSNI
jgi:hypothetical protein